MGIFAAIRNSVNSILPTLFGDGDLASDVTWRRFNASVFNETLGYNEETYDDFDLTAIRVEKELGGTAGRLMQSGSFDTTIGDVVYIFQAPDLPANASVRDLLVDGINTYGVKKIEPVFGLITKVEVKGYA